MWRMEMLALSTVLVTAGNRPGAAWPHRGEIQLAGVSLRYRPDLTTTKTCYRISFLILISR